METLALWPSLEKPSGVHQAARNGYYACLGICTLTLGLLVIGGTLLGAMVDLGFFLLAGLGIRCFSRLAAGAAIVMLAAEQTAAMAGGRLGFGVIALLLIPLLWHASRAAYRARTLGISPVEVTDGDTLLETLENLPALLWPKVWIAFRFYLAGLIAMMLAGIAFRYVGLLA
ncbi:MAG: hypothetical protein K2X03_01170 [Bryobacteraceae bacterium]|nr:hypothetical protein [Bryobacteraceae bacterium]